MKQRFDDTGLEHFVGFFSRALSGSKRNYAAYELELYVVVRAVEHFRMFLLGRKFLLRTDHSALRNLLRRDLPRTSRVERWILRLSEYNSKIEYQKGQDNVMADVLSRFPFAKAHEKKQSTIVHNNLDNTSLDAKLTGPRLLDIPRKPCLCELESDWDSDEETEWHDQTFVVYMKFHVCIMYVSCINTCRYIHETIF